MKKNSIFGKFLLLSALSATMISCNDFDLPSAEYDNDREAPVVPSPPTLNSEWNLVQITNEGQNDPRVFVYKDKKYDAMFTRTMGWNGGDGVMTKALPDGNIYWSFNDSFYGVVDGQTRTRKSSNFPRNSIMVQTGETSDSDMNWLVDYIQTDKPNEDFYYHVRTHIRHPKAKLTEAQIQAGEIDNDYIYWAGDGIVKDDPTYGKVYQTLWGAVDLTAGNGSMIRFGTCLAEYSLQGKVGDQSYLKLVKRDDDFLADKVGYGSTMYDDGDHVYLYTTEAEGFDSRTLVARTATRDLASEWSYYIRDLDGKFQWQTAFPSDEERARSYINTQSGAMPWVFKKGDMYYMTTQSFPYGRAIHIQRSENPYGPFTDAKILFTLPQTLDKLGNPYHLHWYMINLQQSLSREGELVFSTNSEAANFWDNFNREGSADFYRPYFFRVYNWESLYQTQE